MEDFEFVETTNVKEGVVCHVYKYVHDDSRDLGVVEVEKGYKTPKQKVLLGDKTIEIFKSGEGILEIVRGNGNAETHSYPGGQSEIEVNIGDIMQWTAHTDLVFHEICYPPYKENRFENI